MVNTRTAGTDTDNDELLDIKNNYYIGSYQRTIKLAQSLVPSTKEKQLIRDSFLYRAYIAQKKYRIVLEEINESSPLELEPFKILAEYLSKPEKRDEIVAAILAAINKITIDIPIHSYVIVAATILCCESNYEAALRILSRDEDLECSAMNIHIYIQMDRVDLARKELKAMQEKDEDAFITQLCQAWVNIAMGGDKLQDAYYIFQEIVSYYGNTVMLLNGQAVALIGQEKYQEAEPILQEVMDKDSNNPEALINFTVLSRHVGKMHMRHMPHLKGNHEDHKYVKNILSKEDEFDRLVKQYAKVVN